jgi:hypothetical protein
MVSAIPPAGTVISMHTLLLTKGVVANQGRDTSSTRAMFMGCWEWLTMKARELTQMLLQRVWDLGLFA